MAENVVRAEAVMKKIDAEVERIKNVGITPRRQSSCLWIGCDPMPDLRNNRLTSAKGAYKQARFNCRLGKNERISDPSAGKWGSRNGGFVDG
jgi:hypothetical protein